MKGRLFTDSDLRTPAPSRHPLLISTAEVVLVCTLFWYVYIRLFAGRSITLNLQFFRCSASLNAKHVFFLLLLFFVYGLLRSYSDGGVVARSIERLSPFTKGMLLFVLCFGFYMHAGIDRTVSGDTIPAKVLPISIIEEGNLNLDEFVTGITKEHRYCLTMRNGHYYSAYPIFAGMSATPIYFAVKCLFPSGFDTWRLTYAVRNGDTQPHVPLLLEQTSAAIFASVAVVVFWLVCRTYCVPGFLALVLTLAVAFGTPLLSSASWSLWMHGPSVASILLAILFLSRSARNPWYLLLSGMAAGWAFACRPTNLVSMTLLLGFVTISRLRQSWRFALGFFPVVVLVAGINYFTYGQFLGGYQGQARMLTAPNPMALLIHLFSPSRGILLFCPFLILLPFAAPFNFWRRLSLPTFCLLAGLTELALYSCWGVWSGGFSFGPRMLTEGIVCFSLALALSLAQGPPRIPKTTALMGLAVLSIYIHAMGMVSGDANWNGAYFGGKQTYRTFWRVRNSQLMWTLTRVRFNPNNHWTDEIR